jgi:nucleoside-diphosphate-sugar epimerase
MPKKGRKRILVTGSTGQIGSELTIALRKKHGRDNVVATGHVRKPSDGLKSGPFEFVDITSKEAIERVLVRYEIDTIYHLAAVLSATGEQNPQLAWRVNMDGLKNILDIAREHSPVRVFWPSSIAVFGPDVPRTKTPQNAPLNPTTMYGVSKVAGEVLCNYYFAKYGVDVRCVRYPGLVSSVTPPSGGTTDYAVAIYYEAIRNRRYTCFVRKDTTLPMMYMPDALEAALRLMEADPTRVTRHAGYNLTAMSFSAGELAAEIKKHIKGFSCTFKPDSRQKIADSWPMSVDDRPARKEWGWKPTYDMKSMTKDMIEKMREKLGDSTASK